MIESNSKREIYLIHGARNKECAIFCDELSELSKLYSNFHYTLILSEEENKEYRHGFIDASLIKEFVKNYKESTYYLCGPKILTDKVKGYLADFKIKPQHIRYEEFNIPEDITQAPNYPKDVKPNTVFKIKVGDKVIEASSNESILVALERVSIKVNVGCRIGECSYCRIKLVSGNVYTMPNCLLRFVDEKFKYIHSCRAHPLSDLEILL